MGEGRINFQEGEVKGRGVDRVLRPSSWGNLCLSGLTLHLVPDPSSHFHSTTVLGAWIKVESGVRPHLPRLSVWRHHPTPRLFSPIKTGRRVVFVPLHGVVVTWTLSVTPCSRGPVQWPEHCRSSVGVLPETHGFSMSPSLLPWLDEPEATGGTRLRRAKPEPDLVKSTRFSQWTRRI